MAFSDARPVLSLSTRNLSQSASNGLDRILNFLKCVKVSQVCEISSSSCIHVNANVNALISLVYNVTFTVKKKKHNTNALNTKTCSRFIFPSSRYKNTSKHAVQCLANREKMSRRRKKVHNSDYSFISVSYQAVTGLMGRNRGGTHPGSIET